MSIYFMDTSSIEIDKKTWRVIVIDDNIKIKWIECIHNQRHIFGYIKLDWTITYKITKWKKSKDFKESLYRLKEKDNSEYIIIILDNASIHKSKIIKKYCEERNIFLVYLPPYCPDLNPIEWLWKIVKRKFRLIQWDQLIKFEQKIRNTINNLWNQKSLLSNCVKEYFDWFL